MAGLKSLVLGLGEGGPGWRERRGGLKPATDLLFAQLCHCGWGLMDAEGEEPVLTDGPQQIDRHQSCQLQLH